MILQRLEVSLAAICGIGNQFFGLYTITPFALRDLEINDIDLTSPLLKNPACSLPEACTAPAVRWNRLLDLGATDLDWCGPPPALYFPTPKYWYKNFTLSAKTLGASH